MKANLRQEIPDTLIAMFELQLSKTPGNPAVIFGDHGLSYLELNEKANQFAHYLLNLGIEEDTAIAIFMDRSIELFIVMLGILKAGAAYVPLDKSSPQERLTTILNDNQISFLVTTQANPLSFENFKGKIIGYDRVSSDFQKILPLPQIKAQQLAYIIFTSGSTGSPKGVLVEHRSIINYALWFANFCGIETGERIDFSSNPAFDFALTTTLVPLLFGLTVVIGKDLIKKDPKLYLNYLESNRVNYIKLTPGYFNLLLYQEKIAKIPLRYLKKIILGGESLLSPDCVSWLTLFPNHILFNEYGPTEASVGVSVFRIDKNNVEKLGEIVPIGQIIPNCNYFLLDEQLNPSDEEGELYLGGVCLARGYLNNKKVTEKSFIKAPSNLAKGERLYKTGDLCKRLTDGGLECKGRIDEQVKIRGFRIEPAEIEKFLLQYSLIKSAVVKAIPGPHNQKVLVAYYILKNERQRVNEKLLCQFLKRYLPEFMLPSFFVKMDVFPLNANEKIDRKALPLPPTKPTLDFKAPSNTIEKIVMEIWAKELGMDAVSVNANFFELGGHSLSAAKIISSLRYILNKEFSLQELYQNPTIAQISKLLKKRKNLKQPAKKRIKKDFYLPLSDFQFTLWLSTLFEPKAKKLNICLRKRFQGILDEKILKKAFALLIKKHEVLSYKVSSFNPRQYPVKGLKFELATEDFEKLSPAFCEAELERSFGELNLLSWPKNSVPLRARLFHLSDNRLELQLAMPHILSDEISLEILISDLSDFYLTKSTQIENLEENYRDYLINEQSYIKTHLHKDFSFWKNYLQDATLFILPEKFIVPNMHKSKLSYSKYTQIPEKSIEKLKGFCVKNQISLDTGISGVLISALSNCCGQLVGNGSICFNKIQSTRNERRYEKTIGCFLNIVPLKLSINPQQELHNLCQQIHEAMIVTSPYQRCSNLVKLASISNFQQLSKIKNLAISAVVSFYNYLVSSYKLDKKIVNCGARLVRRKANEFLINVNIQNSFLNSNKDNQSLFGLTTEPLKSQHPELLQVDNFLDVCFLRLPDLKPYMVVSANLTPEFKELLAQEILNLCEKIE
ncbi:MAG: non-ribosomal peptide synthetase [Tatlockia sp.]|nr:non-ribosomal peptide synthetase [Tatlockia sp.]